MFKIISLFLAICITTIITTPNEPMKGKPGFSFIGGDSSIGLSIEPDPSFPSSSSISSSIDTSTYIDYFNCPQVYGPFRVGDYNFDATFEYRAKIANQNIIERIRIFNSSNSVVHGASKAMKRYENNELNSVTFEIPIRDYLTYNGITIHFEILNESRAILKSYSASLFPVTSPDLSYIYLKNNVYETESLGFYGDGEDMREAKELFDFTTIEDYIDVDYYYRLDIKSVRFRYESVFYLSYTSAYLVFEDRDNLFPYMTHDSSGTVAIRLQIYKNGDYYYLKYENKFYVNKRTLQVSDSYRNGFALSSDFYLPVNGRKAFNDKTLYFAFAGVGESRLTVTFPLHYSIDKSLVGLCTDGLHCIGGGSR